MPIIEMHLMEGRTAEQKSRAAQAITAAVSEALGASPETVRILITEHRDDEFYVAGKTMQQRAAEKQAQQ
ncbi:MAG: 2-hydroxymuconate tautomerase family protein [Thiolinea sp.]